MPNNNMLMQFMQMVKGGGNPMQMIMNMIQQSSGGQSNPLLDMAQKGDAKGIENFARNYCQSQGIDFDKEFANFRQMLGM